MAREGPLTQSWLVLDQLDLKPREAGRSSAEKVWEP